MWSCLNGEMALPRCVCKSCEVSLTLPCAVMMVMTSAAWAASPQNEGTGAAAQPPVVGTVQPSAIRPINASERWFDGVTFGIGASYDGLTSRTANRFRAPNLGLVISYAERIRGPWSGGVGFWLQSWDRRQSGALPGGDGPGGEGTDRDDVAPLRAMSTVEFAPLRLAYPSGDAPLSWKLAVPYVFGGIGYLTFLRSREWPPGRADGVAGETAVRFGTGVRVVVPDAVAFQLVAERWRGVKTFDYTGYALTLTAEFGDVLVR